MGVSANNFKKVCIFIHIMRWIFVVYIRVQLVLAFCFKKNVNTDASSVNSRCTCKHSNCFVSV